MRLAIVGKMAQSRANRNPPRLTITLFLPERYRAYRDLAKRGLEFLQLVRVSTRQINISVLDINSLMGLYAILVRLF